MSRGVIKCAVVRCAFNGLNNGPSFLSRGCVDSPSPRPREGHTRAGLTALGVRGSRNGGKLKCS